MRLCWIDVYLGPPDIVTHDAEKNFIAKVLLTNAALLHINTKCGSTELPTSRRSATTHQSGMHTRSLPPKPDAEADLKIAIKIVSNSVGLDAPKPVLTAKEARSHLGFSNDPPTPSAIQRAIALRKA